MTKNSETHNVCNERLAREGGKATCCDCDPHEGCTLSDHLPEASKTIDKPFNDLPETGQKDTSIPWEGHKPYSKEVKLQDELQDTHTDWEKDLNYFDFKSIEDRDKCLALFYDHQRHT